MASGLSDTEKTILQIVLIFVLVLLGTLLGGILTWYMALGALASAFIAYLTIMCTRCQRKIERIDKNLDTRLCDIKGLQDIYSGDVTIATTPQIVNVEGKVDKEIWIATFDLSYDLKTFLEVGKKNLERGIIYKYYIPKECEADFEELMSNLEKKGTKKDALKLQTAKYVNASLIPFNVVLYDPSIRKCGYIYSPQEDTNLFIKFDEKSFRQVRNYFKFLEKTGKR